MCPFMRLVPGACGDTSGDRPGPDPVGKSTSTPPLPPPLPLSVSPVMTEATMAHRQQQHPRSQSALPPQLAAVNLHAAGIDIGAEAHYEAVPPSDEPESGRCVGAYPAD
jgi:hypothetical protein